MSNNQIILDGCIKQFISDNEIDSTDSEAFEKFSLMQILKQFNPSYENISNSIVDGGMDGGIDSICILINDEIIETLDDLEECNPTNKTTAKFVISQCKKESTFKEGSLDKMITSLPVLFNLGTDETGLLKRFNPKLVETVILVREVWRKIATAGGKINIDIAYACIASEIEINNVFEDKATQLKTTILSIFTPCGDVNVQLYSSTELLKLYQTHRISRLTLRFKDQPLSTSYQDYGIGYIGTVQLSDYKNFLTADTGEIRDDLFESNIRHFQGHVDVNTKIAETVRGSPERDFWWLNNGITIIAEAPNQIGKDLSIDNVQIVNGLQTSYSIFKNYNGDTSDNRSVLVKVIINTDKETINDIIKSTNSQNPVSPTLLRANNPMQLKLELFFNHEGYFYDRRKNYYKNQGKPSTKIFSIQYLAQAIKSVYFGDPHLARSTPTSLLKEDKLYDAIFDDKKNFKGYLNCCLINKISNEYWSKINNSSDKNRSTNFKLHIAWLLPRIALGKKELLFDDIVNFNLTLLTDSTYQKTLSFLLDEMDKFLKLKPDANLINMAKSKDFTTSISNSL